MSDCDEVDAPIICQTSRQTYSSSGHRSPWSPFPLHRGGDSSPNSQRKAEPLPLSIPSQLERNNQTPMFHGRRTGLTSSQSTSANSTIGHAEQAKTRMPKRLVALGQTSTPPPSRQAEPRTLQVRELKRRIREAFLGKKGTPSERSNTIKQRLQQKIQRARPQPPDNPLQDSCPSSDSEGSEYELANEACTCPVHGRGQGPTDV